MKIILFFTLFVQSLSFSQSLSNPNSFDVVVPKFDFKRPDSGVGLAGTFVFESFNMVRDDFIMNVSNSNQVFDAEVLVRPEFFGIKGSYLNLGFALDKDSLLNLVKKSFISNGKININDRRVLLTAKEFSYETKLSQILLKNMRFFCNRDPDYVDLSIESISRACFNTSQLNSNQKGGVADTQIKLKSITDEGSTIEAHVAVEKLVIEENRVHLEGKETNLIIDESFVLKTNKINAICAKTSNVTEFDTDRFLKNCMGDLDIDFGDIKIIDGNAKSEYYLRPDNIHIENQRIFFKTPVVQIKGEKSVSVLNKLEIDCYRSLSNIDFAVEGVVEECLKSANIKISEAYSEDYGKGSKQLLGSTEELGIVQNLNPNKASARDIIINVKKNKAKIITKVKVLGAYKTLTANANIRFIKDDMVLVVDLTSVKLPLYIFSKSKKLAMFLIKKMLVSDIVSVQNDLVYIKLSTDISGDKS